MAAPKKSKRVNIEDKPTIAEPKQDLVTSVSDVTLGLPINKATSKKTPVIVKEENPEKYIYNRSSREVTVFTNGVKYIIPAKGKVLR